MIFILKIAFCKTAGLPGTLFFGKPSRCRLEFLLRQIVKLGMKRASKALRYDKNLKIP